MNYVKFGQSGFAKRQNRRLYIVNGSQLVTAEKQQAYLPVATGVEVLSAQPVIRATAADGSQVWTKDYADFSANTVYFANADSSDFDVVAAGKLPAIFAGEKFEVQSPFFVDEGAEYQAGDKLTLDADGLLKVAADGDEVVGVVSAGVINLANAEDISGGFTNEQIAAGVSGDSVVSGGPRTWLNDTGSNKVLQFYTVAESAKSDVAALPSEEEDVPAEGDGE